MIEALGSVVDTVNGKAMPAQNAPLVREIKGLDSKGCFSYLSIIRMLLYLSGHLWPGIAYVVNCAECCISCSKCSYDEALNTL